MTAAVCAVLGAIALAAFAWIRSAMTRASDERKQADEMERIIARQEKARDDIERETQARVDAVKTQTDAELEREINR